MFLPFDFDEDAVDEDVMTPHLDEQADYIGGIESWSEPLSEESYTEDESEDDE